MQAIGRSVPYAALICAAGYLLTLTWRFEFPRVAGRLGPDVWPQALLVLLIAACTAGIAGNLLARRRPGASPGASPEAPEATPAQSLDAPAPPPAETVQTDTAAPSRYGLVAGGMALFLVYPVALETLGFVFATFLLMALFMRLGQWRNLLAVPAVSAIGTLALFCLFRGVAYVSLPLGIGPFQSATLWVARLLGMH